MAEEFPPPLRDGKRPGPPAAEDRRVPAIPCLRVLQTIERRRRLGRALLSAKSTSSPAPCSSASTRWDSLRCARDRSEPELLNRLGVCVLPVIWTLVDRSYFPVIDALESCLEVETVFRRSSRGNRRALRVETTPDDAQASVDPLMEAIGRSTAGGCRNRRRQVRDVSSHLRGSTRPSRTCGKCHHDHRQRRDHQPVPRAK